MAGRRHYNVPAVSPNIQAGANLASAVSDAGIWRHFEKQLPPPAACALLRSVRQRAMLFLKSAQACGSVWQVYVQNETADSRPRRNAYGGCGELSPPSGYLFLACGGDLETIFYQGLFVNTAGKHGPATFCKRQGGCKLASHDASSTTWAMQGQACHVIKPKTQWPYPGLRSDACHRGQSWHLRSGCNCGMGRSPIDSFSKAVFSAQDAAFCVDCMAIPPRPDAIQDRTALRREPR